VERLVVPCELKAVSTAAEAGVFEGYGSVFGNADSYADIVAKGAFRSSLKEWKARKRLPSLLWQHDSSIPIGVYEEMREDDTGLYVRGRLSDVQMGRDAYTLLKDGALSGLSIGFRTRKALMDEDTGIRTIKDVDLVEVSLVTFPANDAARVLGVKADEWPDPVEFEQWLRRDAALTRVEARRVVATCYKRLLRYAEDRDPANEPAPRSDDSHSDEGAAAKAAIKAFMGAA
jgi:uncharacterized protein